MQPHAHVLRCLAKRTVKELARCAPDPALQMLALSWEPTVMLGDPMMRRARCRTRKADTHTSEALIACSLPRSGSAVCASRDSCSELFGH